MSLRDELVQLTKELVAIPSVSDDAVQRRVVIDFIAAYCQRLPGVHIERYESRGFPMLVAAFDTERAKDLILNAHVDVVPARPEQWQAVERDGRLYGRGTQDMKAASAAMLVLLKALAEAGKQPNVSWQFVTDEEIGGDDGTGYLLRQGYTGQLFVAGEPTDLHIVNRAKGILWVTVTMNGIPAHGSRPWDGDNPIIPLATGLRKLLERYPIPAEPVWRTTVTPAAIHGGDAQNRVPVDCLLKLDIRRVPDEEQGAIMYFVEQCFPGATVQTPHDGSCLNTDSSAPALQRLVSSISAEMGQPARFRDEHFGSDARYYSQAGTAAVCFGPRGAGLHSHEEWVEIESILTFYHVLERLVTGS
ncbi:MAG: M20/M25/M40 family metallo-hydrolase [Herpetosiphonaceae bacterium]|nr:M20/M25/M40 family metallo-hydrolase [Herpetosiphonaceae bacterium]